MNDALIDLAQRGDTAAIEALLIAARPVVACRVYRVLGRHDADADDIIQAVMIKVWRKLDTFHGGNFIGWLNRVATNTCYDLLRSRRRTPVDWEEVDRLDPDADPLMQTLNDERYTDLRRAVAGLAEPYAATLTAMYLQGMNYAEVSALLGVPDGTIKSRVHRGRQALATMLEK